MLCQAASRYPGAAARGPVDDSGSGQRALSARLHFELQSAQAATLRSCFLAQLFVMNIPEGTTAEKVKEAFGAHGACPISDIKHPCFACFHLVFFQLRRFLWGGGNIDTGAPRSRLAPLRRRVHGRALHHLPCDKDNPGHTKDARRVRISRGGAEATGMPRCDRISLTPRSVCSMAMLPSKRRHYMVCRWRSSESARSGLRCLSVLVQAEKALAALNSSEVFGKAGDALLRCAHSFYGGFSRLSRSVLCVLCLADCQSYPLSLRLRAFDDEGWFGTRRGHRAEAPRKGKTAAAAAAGAGAAAGTGAAAAAVGGAAAAGAGASTAAGGPWVWVCR